MKPPSNPCSKHSSTIPQAMLGGCQTLCLMRARRCLCVLRTPDFELRTSVCGLGFRSSSSSSSARLSLYLFITTNERVKNLKTERVGELCYEV